MTFSGVGQTTLLLRFALNLFSGKSCGEKDREIGDRERERGREREREREEREYVCRRECGLV